MLTRPYRAHDQVTYRPARTTRDALSNGFDWFTAPPTKASHRLADRAVMVACAIALIALALIAAHERGWFTRFRPATPTSCPSHPHHRSTRR